MKLTGRRIDEWLRWSSGNSKAARERSAFARKYANIAERLQDAHRIAVASAVAAEAREQAARGEEIDPGLLTDHGPHHVEKVIERATDLIAAEGLELSTRELFMLLLAIQLHDVGNAYGREHHEEKVWEVLRRVRGDDLDEVETRAICQIVEAHGGETADGSKDRIGPIYPQQQIFGQTVRLQLLAAILRFADELAEDSSRAARFLMESGQLPKRSEAYHEYAKSLRSVTVNATAKEVALAFVLDRRLATTQIGKDNGELLLLDYIFSRTRKMHYERIYCSRFTAPHALRVEQIKVEVLFLEEDGREFHDAIRYRLEDRGYPTEEPLATICQDDLRVPGTDRVWTGELLKARLEPGGGNA